jgi:ATP-dependent DNA helicase RecG
VLESEVLEIKGWCKDERQLTEKISDVAVCLANAHGGILVIGIEDGDIGKSKFSRCPHSNASIEWITQRIHDTTVPPVEISVYDASDVLREITQVTSANCFTVHISQTRRVGGHQTIGGLSRKRSGRECKPYYFAEDDRTKAPIPAAAISDLSLASIQWGIEQHAKKFGTPITYWESPVDFLTHTGLLETFLPDEEQVPQLRVSVAALLLFGEEQSVHRHFPASEVIVVAADREGRLRTNIVETYRTLCVSRSSLLPSLCPGVPIKSIRELVVNALIQRSYRESCPIVVRVRSNEVEIESPGPLPAGLSPDSLIRCIPVYRNFLLAEGARYLGLCDKIGRGIDDVYEQVLAQGFGFPVFQSDDNHFSVRLPLEASKEFQHFVVKRSQALSQLDEIIVLRYLYDREVAPLRDLCQVMQRSPQFAYKILTEMTRELMIEPIDSKCPDWRLTPTVRSDIEHIFQVDQYDLEFDRLFGEDGSPGAPPPRLR